MSINEKIRAIRKYRQLSQKDIQERTGINDRQVQMYESGKRTPKAENLEKIADALDVDVWALKDLDIDPNSPRSLAHLLFLLEENGVFSIDDIQPETEYVDHKPVYRLSFPCAEELIYLVGAWKYHADESNFKLESIDCWKDGVLQKNSLGLLPLGEATQDYYPTSYKLDLDLIGYKEALDLLEKGNYTEQDFERLMRRLDLDTAFARDPEAIERMTSIFAAGIIPEEFIHPLFEVQYPPFDFPIIASGALRKAYDQAKKSTAPDPIE